MLGSVILEAFPNLNDSIILIISSGFKLSPATLVLTVALDISVTCFLLVMNERI